jgi:hypothetical protein
MPQDTPASRIAFARSSFGSPCLPPSVFLLSHQRGEDEAGDQNDVFEEAVDCYETFVASHFPDSIDEKIGEAFEDARASPLPTIRSAR